MMQNQKHFKRITKWVHSLNISNKLNIFSYGIMLLFTILTGYLIFSLVSFCNSYNQIVVNITAANNYNLDFKEDVDYALYRMIAGCIPAKEIEDETGLSNPYVILNEARSVFSDLQGITTGEGNVRRIRTLIKSINTLEKRIQEIDETVESSGFYDRNMEYLDNNIHILTELIQEQIQQYIYYEASNLETVRLGLEAKKDEAVNISVILLLTAALITFLSSFAISRSIAKPIQNLCKTTELVAKGNFTTRAEQGADDEISILTTSFNSMIGQIGELVDNIKEEQLNLRATELKLLQEQINPHFLYNTLDTIIWLAEAGQNKEVVSMVNSLSDFFRSSLSKGRDFIKVVEEEAHIRSYLEIQQFRYRDILEYEIVIPKELEEFTIIKLTLQPIIENALYHGIKNKRGLGKITVTAEDMGEEIRFIVEDNGIGMNEETLERLRNVIDGKEVGDNEGGFGF